MGSMKSLREGRERRERRKASSLVLSSENNGKFTFPIFIESRIEKIKASSISEAECNGFRSDFFSDAQIRLIENGINSKNNLSSLEDEIYIYFCNLNLTLFSKKEIEAALLLVPNQRHINKMCGASSSVKEAGQSLLVGDVSLVKLWQINKLSRVCIISESDYKYELALSEIRSTGMHEDLINLSHLGEAKEKEDELKRLTVEEEWKRSEEYILKIQREKEMAENRGKSQLYLSLVGLLEETI